MSEKKQHCVKIIVSGRVQGVYFRAFSQKQALKRGITGYAKNLPDGNVEIVACGTESACQQLIAWCHKGPLLAKVSAVEVHPFPDCACFSDFSIR